MSLYKSGAALSSELDLGRRASSPNGSARRLRLLRIWQIIPRTAGTTSASDAKAKELDEVRRNDNCINRQNYSTHRRAEH